MSKDKPSMAEESSLIQRKGATEKPLDLTAPAAAAPTPAPKAAPAAEEPKTKSLTLRLSESQYDRLRHFAFERRLSHQAIIEAALMDHLERSGG